MNAPLFRRNAASFSKRACRIAFDRAPGVAGARVRTRRQSHALGTSSLTELGPFRNPEYWLIARAMDALSIVMEEGEMAVGK
jgi:hypothetical protein